LQDYSAFDFLRHLLGPGFPLSREGVIRDQGPRSSAVYPFGKKAFKPCRLKVKVSICKESYPIEKGVSAANLDDFLAKSEYPGKKTVLCDFNHAITKRM
jgi:hypothetical protein